MATWLRGGAPGKGTVPLLAPSCGVSGNLGNGAKFVFVYCNYLYALASLDLKLLLRDLLIEELGIVYTRRFLTTPLNEFAEMCDLEFGLTPYIRQNPLTHY